MIYYPNDDSIAMLEIVSHVGMQDFYVAPPQISLVSSCLGSKGTDWKNGRHSVTYGAERRQAIV